MTYIFRNSIKTLKRYVVSFDFSAYMQSIKQDPILLSNIAHKLFSIECNDLRL